MNRRLCIYVSHFYPHIGGLERYVEFLSKKLLKLGYDVTIVTSNTNQSPYYEEYNGLKIYRLPVFNIIDGRFPLPKLNGIFFGQMKKIKSQQYDFIILNTRFFYTSFFGVRHAKKYKLPAFLIEHGSGHLDTGNGILNKFGELYEHTITSYIKHRVKSFYGVSKACCEWLSHFHIKAEGVLYNGIDTQGKELSQKNKNDKTVVAFTGRLLEQKGVAILCEAVEKLSERQNVELRVAGIGPLYDELSAKYKDSKAVRLLGRLDYQGVCELLSETDIFCLPTLYPEGLPTSVLEAGLFGCAAIGSTWGGTPEIIEGGAGIILKEVTPETIADAIEYYITHPEEREAAAKKLHERVITTFSWDEIAKKADSIIQGKLKV